MFGPKSPAYSIGSSKRQDLNSSKQVPGPASYNISRDPIHRSISFNRAPKHTRRNSDLPGPTSYNINSNLGSGPHAVIISRRSLKSSTEIPGPADYTPKDSLHSIKYSIANKSNNLKIEVGIPGPGAYNNQVQGKNSPRAVIGKAPRVIENNFITPGPGSYDPVVVKPAMPKFTFSSTPRMDSERLDLYSYSVRARNQSSSGKRPQTARNDSNRASNEENWKKNEKSQELFHEKVPKEQLPGPGQYEVGDIINKKKSPSAVFGTSKKNDTSIETAPGPGDYWINRNLKGFKYTFSKQKRYSNKAPNVPGPGQYEIPHTIGFSLNGKSTTYNIK